MSRGLDDLDPRFRPWAVELLARLTEAGIPVLIVDTLRTPAEHAANLQNGTSWTARSRHLDGLAIDICPWAEFRLHGPDKLAWNGADPVWARVGAIGEAIEAPAGGRIVWGGRWRQRDLGHFELQVQE